MGGCNEHALARMSVALAEEIQPLRRWTTFTAGLSSIGLDEISYGFLTGASRAANDSLPPIHTNRMIDYAELRDDLDGCTRADDHMGDFSPMLWGEGSAKSAISYGIYPSSPHTGSRHGLLIPVAGSVRSGAQGAAILIGTSQPETVFRNIIGTCAMGLVSVAHMLHAGTVGELLRRRDDAGILTLREQDCLQLAAKGLRVGELADCIGIAPVTVEMHLRNARRKLNSLTIAEAVAKALLYQQITHD